MKFVPDPWTDVWLKDFVPETENFDWDDGNRDKSTKHEVSWQEIESIFLEAEYVFAGKIIEPAHEEWRGLIFGRTDGGRLLTLIFTRRGEKLRPISCRPMREKERRLYETNI